MSAPKMDTSPHPSADCCVNPTLPNPPKNPIIRELNSWVAPAVSALLLVGAVILDHVAPNTESWTWVKIIAFITAYVPVAAPVLSKAMKLILQGDVFTEFSLMGLATLGAFTIGEYPEAVAVMLFYTVGELIQGAAVARAKRNIHALLDLRPDTAHVFRNGSFLEVSAKTVIPGELIQCRAGEQVALDGIIEDGAGSFETAALTGESAPVFKSPGDRVMAGMVSLDAVVKIRVKEPYDNSAVARIIHLVQEAAGRKAKTEQFIRKFARVYTPIVTFLALGVVVIPWFFVADYDFQAWLYRALVFLVISCPCALVISIPLGYLGGLGAASKQGILFKGSNFLDIIGKTQTLILDKTGTVTEGIFNVNRVESSSELPWMLWAAALEQGSSHPVAQAICDYVEANHAGDLPTVKNQQEVAGKGTAGWINGQHVVVGNRRMMELNQVNHLPPSPSGYTVVYVAVDGVYHGLFLISDQLKADAADAIKQLQALGIREFHLLSGDRQSAVDLIADQLPLNSAVGNLLPEEKVQHLDSIMQASQGVVAFVGDGINDAPSLARADIGIAMGAAGTDLAIDTADAVIQTDQLSKIATAIRISRFTKQVVWQNIGLAFTVKIAVMALGAIGMAAMWEAVFADVGVALLAILNAIRIQKV